MLHHQLQGLLDWGKGWTSKSQRMGTENSFQAKWRDIALTSSSQHGIHGLRQNRWVQGRQEVAVGSASGHSDHGPPWWVCSWRQNRRKKGSSHPIWEPWDWDDLPTARRILNLQKRTMTMSKGFGNIGAISPQSRTPQALQASLLKPPLETSPPHLCPCQLTDPWGPAYPWGPRIPYR